jgi:malonyl-CoA/methylmalonyl-CoA synthetase
VSNEHGYYKILGRLSQDIIKKSGYKLSALEIESRLLEHPDVAEACVLGVPHEKYGEEVACIIVPKDLSKTEHKHLKEYCETHLSTYKVPKIWKMMKALPRNAMGKVSKK